MNLLAKNPPALVDDIYQEYDSRDAINAIVSVEFERKINLKKNSSRKPRKYIRYLYVFYRYQNYIIIIIFTLTIPNNECKIINVLFSLFYYSSLIIFCYINLVISSTNEKHSINFIFQSTLFFREF